MTMDSFTWHLQDVPILAGGYIPTSLPASTLDENLTLRLTQQFQIELLYLFITDAVNVVYSPITCEIFSPSGKSLQPIENGTLHAHYYERIGDLVQDLGPAFGRCVAVTTIRKNHRRYLRLKNRFGTAIKLAIPSRLACLLGFKFQTASHYDQFELILRASETHTAPFPIDLTRGNHIAHLHSVDVILTPPTLVHCTACLKHHRLASALSSLMWEPSPREPTTLVAKQLSQPARVNGLLTRKNFTLSLLDGELKPFPSGHLTRLTAGIRFTKYSSKNVDQNTIG